MSAGLLADSAQWNGPEHLEVPPWPPAAFPVETYLVSVNYKYMYMYVHTCTYTYRCTVYMYMHFYMYNVIQCCPYHCNVSFLQGMVDLKLFVKILLCSRENENRTLQGNVPDVLVPVRRKQT